MTLSTRFDEALALAADLHREQKRNGTEIPYISHLMSVCALVLEHGGSEDQAIAALLHDAVEDQGGEPVLAEIRRRFGDEVARMVADCTDAWEKPKPPWRKRKEDYLASLPAKPPTSLLISLADKTHNAKAILRDHGQIGDEIWRRFKGGREGTIWYYQSLAVFFTSAMPGPLADELSTTVAQFTRDSNG